MYKLAEGLIYKACLCTKQGSKWHKLFLMQSLRFIKKCDGKICATLSTLRTLLTHILDREDTGNTATEIAKLWVQVTFSDLQSFAQTWTHNQQSAPISILELRIETNNDEWKYVEFKNNKQSVSRGVVVKTGVPSLEAFALEVAVPVHLLGISPTLLSPFLSCLLLIKATVTTNP